MVKIKALFFEMLNLTPIITLIFGYNRYLMEKMDKKLDMDTYIREREIFYELQSRGEKNILNILTRIENRIEKIEQRLMR